MAVSYLCAKAAFLKTHQNTEPKFKSIVKICNKASINNLNFLIVKYDLQQILLTLYCSKLEVVQQI